MQFSQISRKINITCLLRDRDLIPHPIPFPHQIIHFLKEASLQGSRDVKESLDWYWAPVSVGCYSSAHKQATPDFRRTAGCAAASFHCSSVQWAVLGFWKGIGRSTKDCHIFVLVLSLLSLLSPLVPASQLSIHCISSQRLKFSYGYGSRPRGRPVLLL